MWSLGAGTVWVVLWLSNSVWAVTARSASQARVIPSIWGACVSWVAVGGCSWVGGSLAPRVQSPGQVTSIDRQRGDTGGVVMCCVGSLAWGLSPLSVIGESCWVRKPSRGLSSCGEHGRLRLVCGVGDLGAPGKGARCSGDPRWLGEAPGGWAPGVFGAGGERCEHWRVGVVGTVVVSVSAQRSVGSAVV